MLLVVHSVSPSQSPRPGSWIIENFKKILIFKKKSEKIEEHVWINEHYVQKNLATYSLLGSNYGPLKSEFSFGTSNGSGINECPSIYNWRNLGLHF